ncbi:cation-transporting P-type ATPase, partial [Methanomethylovorans sp.]|uniref:P-type ATPase n=1 Tax=Methanomethylovorans sp. TaxID=2758717 RepID=UPI00351C8049
MNNLDGLSSTEVADRLVRFGPNALPVPRYRLLRLILRQFRGVFNLLLLGAAGLTFALGEPIDGSFILMFVILGTTLNVFQEYKSNAAADKLKSYLVSTITVRRDGRDQEVPTDGIVPGDIIKLESGDIVPADAVIRQARDLLVDETTFTGESIPVSKQATTATDQEAGDEHRLLQGVVIIRGNTLAEVTATGVKTRLAAIAATASSLQVESELVKGIDR